MASHVHHSPADPPAESVTDPPEVEDFLHRVRSNIIAPYHAQGDELLNRDFAKTWEQNEPRFREWARYAEPAERAEVLERARIDFEPGQGYSLQAALEHHLVSLYLADRPIILDCLALIVAVVWQDLFVFLTAERAHAVLKLRPPLSKVYLTPFARPVNRSLYKADSAHAAGGMRTVGYPSQVRHSFRQGCKELWCTIQQKE